MEESPMRMTLGFLFGVLLMGTFFFLVLVRYVSTDLEAFRVWLDSTDAP
jgi:hypothetical protein